MSFSSRHERPIGASNKAQGGAAFNQSVSGLEGESDLVTVFDDFNQAVTTTTFGTSAGATTSNGFEDAGWVCTDVGTPSNDQIGQNDVGDVDQWIPSCLRIDTGDTEDTGGNMQLDWINSRAASAVDVAGTADFRVNTPSYPHLWIPETAAGAGALDNQILTFSCRLGFRADDEVAGDTSGDWDSKAFIGFAVAGDTGIMTASTGALASGAAAQQLLGFHINEDGDIHGIAQRDGSVSYAAGTNFTELKGAGAVDGTVANGSNAAGDTVWYDLALRARVTDWSDDDANGAVEFYYRRVMPTLGIGGDRSHPGPGRGSAWVKHGTALENAIPYHTVALVPTIEVINGPTADRDGVVYLDWWSFGVTRPSSR